MQAREPNNVSDDDKASLEALKDISFFSVLAHLLMGALSYWHRHELMYAPVLVNTLVGIALFGASYRMCQRGRLSARTLYPWMLVLGFYSLAAIAFNYHCGLRQGIQLRIIAVMVGAGLCLERRLWLASFLACCLGTLVLLLHNSPHGPLFIYSVGLLGILLSLAAHSSVRQSLPALFQLTRDQAEQNRLLETTLEEAHVLGGNLDREVRLRTDHLERTYQELSQILQSQADLLLETTGLEKQMEEGRRLEAVGQAAGACAHDLNNILAILTCSLECLDELHPGGAGQAEMRQAIDRVAHVGRAMLSLSGHQILQREAVEVATLAGEWGPMLTRLLGEAYQFEQVIQSPETRLVCDKQQLFLVLAKLLINATEAMPNGGSLRLSGRRLDQAHYQFELEDQGPGIAPELRETVFEPFFTSKEGSQHAGLGLSTARAFLRQLGGSLQVDASLQGGALLRLILPSQPPDPAENTP